MKRPVLHKIPLAAVLPIGEGHYRGFVITMAQGQWDNTLASYYASGDVLLELNASGEPSAAYQKPSPKAVERAS